MSEEDFTDPCVGCGADQSQVDFSEIHRCDRCEGTVCKECAVAKPVKFSIVDEILCPNCSK